MIDEYLLIPEYFGRPSQPPSGVQRFLYGGGGREPFHPAHKNLSSVHLWTKATLSKLRCQIDISRRKPPPIY